MCGRCERVGDWISSVYRHRGDHTPVDFGDDQAPERYAAPIEGCDALKLGVVVNGAEPKGDIGALNGSCHVAWHVCASKSGCLFLHHELTEIWIEHGLLHGRGVRTKPITLS